MLRRNGRRVERKLAPYQDLVYNGIKDNQDDTHTNTLSLPPHGANRNFGYNGGI